MPLERRWIEGQGWRTVSATDGGGGGGDLPDWWDVDSTPGSESVEFGGNVVVSPATGGSNVLLNVFAGPGETQPIARFDTDEGGAVFFPTFGDGTVGIRQESIDGDPLFVVGPSGAVTISPSGSGDAGAQALRITGHEDASIVFSAFDFGGNAGLDFGVTNGLRVYEPTGGNDVFVVGPTGAVTISPSDPAEGLAVDRIKNASGGFDPAVTFGSPVIIDPTTDDDVLVVRAGAATTDGRQVLRVKDDANRNYFAIEHGPSPVIGTDVATINLLATDTIQVGYGSTLLSFFGVTPAAKPTGVAVTAGGIHAALVTLGLIAA